MLIGNDHLALMRKVRSMTRLLRPSALMFGLLLPGLCVAQDIEPRRWTHLPIGLNVVTAGYVYTDGDIFFDPVLQIDGAEVEMHTVLGIYTRAFPLAGRTARLDVVAPAKDARWQGFLDGVFTTAEREGLGDPIVRFSIGLAGAPALRDKEFQEFRAAHRTDTVVGAGLAVVLPLGEYKEDKLLNLGSNRFIVQPEIGLVHTRGPWSYELTGSVLFFEDNDEFWDGNKLEQDPLFALQAHVIHTFHPGLWLSLSAAYGHDGESIVNDARKDDPRDVVFSALSFGFPIGQANGFKFAYIRGRSQEDTGADTDSFGVAWSRRF